MAIFIGLKRKKHLRTFRACGHFGPFEASRNVRKEFFLSSFYHFYENDFSDFLHLIDLFNDYLCFYTYLKQLNFFADIPGRGHSGPLQTSAKTHVQTAREFPDLNMGFAV